MTQFKIHGKIVKRDRRLINDRVRIDLLIEDGSGKRHYVQVRPNQFSHIAAVPDHQKFEFHLENEYSKSGDLNFNNLILKNIQ